MKAIKEIFSLDEDRKLLNKAINEYGFKTALDRYKTLYQVAQKTRILLGILSIVGGFYAVYSQLILLTHVIVAGVLSACILTAVEVFKHIASTHVFTDVIGGLKSNYIVFALLLTFTASMSYLSFNFSVDGIEAIHQAHDKTVKETKLSNSSMIDSINTSFNTRINTVKSEIEAYKGQVSYKGKINIHNKANRQILSNYDKQLERLNIQHQNAIYNAESESNKAVVSAEYQFSKNASFWFIVAVSNEVLILLLVYFIQYYYYLIHKEKEVIESAASIIDENEIVKAIRSVFNSVSNNTLNTPINIPIVESETAKGIGFKMPAKDINTAINTPINQINTPINTVKNNIVQSEEEEYKKQAEEKRRAFLEKYKEVVKDMQGGMSYTKLQNKHAVSKSTLQNIRRTLNN